MKGDVLKAKDYRTDLQPVWCTGCGDFGVLKGLTQALADLQIEPEKLAVISGIGCSSRLPGYVKAYSFNSIHGRALPIATGLKPFHCNLPRLGTTAGEINALASKHFQRRLFSARHKLPFGSC